MEQTTEQAKQAKPRNFFPLPSNVAGLWQKDPQTGKPVKNQTRWDEFAAERAEHCRVASVWRDAAVQDGWLISPTYAHEDITCAASLNWYNFTANIITRTSGPNSLGTGSVNVWGPDKLMIPVPLIYPGAAYFQNALTTCPHCHKTDVKTVGYHFTGRACTECAPALRAIHEQEGWCD